MATNEKEIVNGIEVDVDKAQRLIKKVIVKEMIEEEVECY